MTIADRIKVFEVLFEDLQATTSRITKEQIVAEFQSIYPQLQEDWNYILETLDNRHPIGWTLEPRMSEDYDDEYNIGYTNISEIISGLEKVKEQTGLNNVSTKYAELAVGEYGEFIAPIVNRTLKLGIGKSLLSKTDITPMLAKKYEGQYLHNDVYVTEKLDGNRCIAHHDGVKWNFTSRNGKPMNVNFDMMNLPKCFIYDGEVMSKEQTELSIKRNEAIKNSTFMKCNTEEAQLMFNKTSGLINRHGEKTGLVYTIFDIITPLLYEERRKYLNDCLHGIEGSEEVRILPTLYKGRDIDHINNLLDTICSMGGEGIMLNVHNRKYEPKRTDALLKYKQVQYCDMRVIDTYEGEGKYREMCGGIVCYMRTDTGKEVNCKVGSGLSDAQREQWFVDPTEIIGKIVEVGYHEMTQDARSIGTNLYSLRFPRLIRVREDKSETSEY